MTQSGMAYNDVNENGLLDLDVYFDFLCPFSYQAAAWVRQVAELMGPEVISVRWRFLSIEQFSKSKDNQGWNIWDQKPDSSEVKGLLPFLAGGVAHAAGGEQALSKFYEVLGRMRHEEGLSIWERGIIEKAWQEAGLDASLLQGVFDGSDRRGYEKLQNDHTEAVQKYNAFGTPTLVFEESRAFFLKLMPRPEATDEALELFQHLQRLAMGFRHGVLEFKRPLTEEQEAEVNSMKSKSTQGL
ncbi:MAG TPA: DsbA family protein [Chloroflexia bacterium]|nr:DsbA family protein [Chloroflexia bacterium]